MRGWTWAAIAVTALALAGAAWAHVLTGTSIAGISDLLIGRGEIRCNYSVHFGDVAAIKPRRDMDLDKDYAISDDEARQYVEKATQTLADNLILEVDGERVPVVLENGQLDLLGERSQGSFPVNVTFTFRASFRNPEAEHELAYHDHNYKIVGAMGIQTEEGRPEITVRMEDGLAVLKRWDWDAGKFVGEVTDGVPLSRAVQVVFGPPGDRPVRSVVGEGTSLAGLGGGLTGEKRLRKILANPTMSPKFILIAVAIALFLGAAHALEPGHGKTIVAAYLVGSRGTVWHALLLGGVVTFTHTVSVILLGLIALFASQYIMPAKLFPWLGFASGFLITGIGVWLFTRAYAGKIGGGHVHGPDGHQHDHPHDDPDHHAHEHDDEHGHAHPHGHDHANEHEHPHGPDVSRASVSDHHHDHGHTHALPSQVSLGSLLGLGITGGIVPCPGALVILLTAVALNRILFGLSLIVFFSIGLAAVLITIGILMVTARSYMDRFATRAGKLTQILPMVSAVVISVLGVVIALQALVRGGVITINV